MRDRLRATADDRATQRAARICSGRHGWIGTKCCTRDGRRARCGEGRRGNDAAQASCACSFNKDDAANPCSSATTDPLCPRHAPLRAIDRRRHRMRKCCTRAKVERHLRRLMRRPASNGVERIVNQCDLFGNRREECGNILLGEIARGTFALRHRCRSAS